MANKKFGDYTDDELDQMYEAATRAGEKALATEPRAAKAHYDKSTDRLVIDLISGASIAIPRQDIQCLNDASPSEIGAIKLRPFGVGLHWEKLDLDLTVAGLVSGVLGTKAWMAELGRRGGATTSDAKAAAARENGKKGGRPRKVQAHSVGQ